MNGKTGIRVSQLGGATFYNHRFCQYLYILLL